MSTFNFIAVRVLEGCQPHIRKILKENTTYFLRNEYFFDESEQWVRRADGCRAVPADFYSCGKTGNGLQINISAIVGQNGDGKSSMVELALRVLNNFACSCGYFLFHEDLVPVSGVWAVLYYSIDGKVFAIECKGDEIVFYRENEDGMKEKVKGLPTNTPLVDMEFLKKELEPHFFYTLALNYSLYAYNSEELTKEYTKENRCWIESIFHKNDGYQTPVVLNPFRRKGNIDVNVENALGKQRLMAMFVDNSIKEINRNEVPLGFAFRLEKESKLVTRTLKGFMEVGHHDLEKDFDDFDSKFLKIPSTNEDEMQDILTTFWEAIDECMKKNEFLFETALKIHKEIEQQQGSQKISLSHIKFERSILYFVAHIRANKNYYGKVGDIVNRFTERHYEQLNFSAIHRIMMVHEIKKLWDEKFKELGIATGGYYDWEGENTAEARAKAYMVYKSIDTLETYRIQYGEYFLDTTFFSRAFILNGKGTYDRFLLHIRHEFENLYKDICYKKSHITLKIRQTLNFLLKNAQYRYLDSDGKQEKVLWKVLPEGDYPNYIDFGVYRKRIDRIINENEAANEDSKLPALKTIELLPPPIFEVEVVAMKEGEPVLLSTMSSGERQLLNSISGVVYHLRNIDSAVETEKTVGYRFVNLVFEEIELYFHPEFQRQFILKLTEMLKGMEFKRLEAVNMCFVTHSPFILSDIPKSNVLFLEDGLPVFPMQEDTFGANIHTLLHNGFFLSNVPIGAFAQHKINSLFGRLHKGEATAEIYNDILLVSEPILKSQLLKLYRQYKGDYREEIEGLKREIESLKKLLNLKK